MAAKSLRLAFSATKVFKVSFCIVTYVFDEADFIKIHSCPASISLCDTKAIRIHLRKEYWADWYTKSSAG